MAGVEVAVLLYCAVITVGAGFVGYAAGRFFVRAVIYGSDRRDAEFGGWVMAVSFMILTFCAFAVRLNGGP